MQRQPQPNHHPANRITRASASYHASASDRASASDHASASDRASAHPCANTDANDSGYAIPYPYRRSP